MYVLVDAILVTLWNIEHKQYRIYLCIGSVAIYFNTFTFGLLSVWYRDTSKVI